MQGRAVGSRGRCRLRLPVFRRRFKDSRDSRPPAPHALASHSNAPSISVSDKTGLAEFARALVAAGVEIFSTGGTRRASGRGRHPGPRRRRLHRLSRNDGRPDQNAAPQNPRRHPLPPRPPRRHGRHRRARHRAVRAGRGEPLSVRADGRPPGVTLDEAIEKSTSAARRWSAPPRRITRSSRSPPTRASTQRSSSNSRDAARPRRSCAASWPAPRSPTRPSTTRRSPRTSQLDAIRLPPDAEGWAGVTRDS